MVLKFTIVVSLVLLFHVIQAFEVVVVNNGNNPVYPRVQGKGDPPGDDASDNIEGWLQPGEERVYDNDNEFLTTDAIDVKEGDTRTMSILDNGVVVKECGEVEFSEGTILTYEDDQCTQTSMGIVTADSQFHLPSPYPDTKRYAWIVADFDPGTPGRFYASGPEVYIWSGASKKSTITVEVVNHENLEYSEVELTAYKQNGPCNRVQMNDAVGCTSGGPYDLYVEKYNPDANPNLPPGQYSGVIKLQGEVWHSTGVKEITYLNLEIDNA